MNTANWLSKAREEMNIRGVASLGHLLNQEDIEFFRNDLKKKKQEDIEEFGVPALMVKPAGASFTPGCFTLPETE